jgi:hypothetical protein
VVIVAYGRTYGYVKLLHILDKVDALYKEDELVVSSILRRTYLRLWLELFHPTKYTSVNHIRIQEYKVESLIRIQAMGMALY